MAASVTKLIRHDSKIHSIEKLYNALDGNQPNYSEVLTIFSEISEIVKTLPKYDVIGMDELTARLRKELKNIHSRTDGLNSINKLSAKIDVSRAYLARFRDGDAVCMNIMNRIANAFNIRYLVENYSEAEKPVIE